MKVHVQNGTRFRAKREIKISFAEDAPIPKGAEGVARVTSQVRDQTCFEISWLGLPFSATTCAHEAEKLPDYLELV